MWIIRVVTSLTVMLLLCVSILPRATAYSSGIHHRPACPAVSHRLTRCLAQIATDAQGAPLASADPLPGAYGPVQFHTAYNLPCSVKGKRPQSVCPAPTSFGGQTIAIVDWHSHPNIEADLATYDQAYGLPACTTSNGCLTIVNEYGQSSPLPAPDQGWGLEISLDVEIAHMICQTCKILLVEADSLLDGVNEAATLGATEISNSYTWGERSDGTSLDLYYNHRGIAVVAATGDSGYGPAWPADSPSVVAVGGTTLNLGPNGAYGSESAWSGAGSGCSLYETANSWQTALANWSQTECGLARGVADVAADADPATGAAVYDSYGYGGWLQVGGTSLASPLIAGVYALAGGVSPGTNAQSVPYARSSRGSLHDVTIGNTGACGTIMCTAGSGYDGPTGLGTPNGLGAF
jgi:subtilase family serine protease